ncbi:MAG: hypothetical protein RR455_12855 [Bacteroidales bacterium]
MGLYIESLDSCIREISDVINTYVDTLEKKQENIVGDSSALPTEESRAKFYANIQNTLKDIYRALNLSAISGEYVNVAEVDFVAIIEDTYNKVGEIITLLSDRDAEEEGKTLLNTANCIRRDLHLYKFQIHLFWKSVNNPRVKFVDYDIINDDNAEIKDNNIQDIELLSDIFHANLNLVLIDREFSFHEQLFRILNGTCHKLHEYNDKIKTDYIDILLHKCHILLAKFNYKDNIDNLLQSYNYYNGRDEKVAMAVDGAISERLKSIYTKDIKAYKRTISRLHQENIEGYNTFFDFLIKCHYFKNITENEVLLQDLIKKFESFQKSIVDSFDRKNASSCLNFLNNCRLSFILKQKDTSSITVWNEKLKIKSVQDSTNIRNYFPFLKIAEWYSAYLSKQIEETDDANNLMINLHGFEDSLDMAEEYLIDSKDNAGCFIPFKPSFQECLEKYEFKTGEWVDIFISSSYIVPVDYEKEEKRIKQLQSELIKLKAIIEAKKSIDSVILRLRAENKSLQEEVQSLKENSVAEAKQITNNVQSDLKENQKSNIQILAIFAGIVIFASGTIQIFKGASNVKDATIFMLLFASALSIISLSIWLLFTSKEKWGASKIIFAIILAIILGLNTYAIWGDWGKEIINTQTHENASK